MTKPLDESYFEWLYSQVAPVEVQDPKLTYWKLLKELYSKEFVWIIPNDDNRIEDGKELRREFIHEEGLEDVDPHWIDLGCSMLELIMGLSRRLEFEADAGEPHYWFWHLIANIGLERYTDKSRRSRRVIDEILDTVIFRTYGSDGHGGLFPLDNPQKDQRKVELWYQLSAYVVEHMSTKGG